LISQEKAAIAAKADAHYLSASSCLRRLGLALPVESTIDQRRGPQPKPDNTQVRSSAHAGEWLFLRREHSVAAPRAAHAGGPSTV